MEKRISNYLLAAGWILFVVSLFLPALDLSKLSGPANSGTETEQSPFGFSITPTGTVSGWNAFGTSLLALEQIGDSWANVFLALQGLTNFLMVLSPFMLYVRKPKVRKIFVFAMLAAMLVNCLGMFRFGLKPLMVGYYAWCLSFAVVTLSFYLRRQSTVEEEQALSLGI